MEVEQETPSQEMKNSSEKYQHQKRMAPGESNISSNLIDIVGSDEEQITFKPRLKKIRFEMPENDPKESIGMKEIGSKLENLNLKKEEESKPSVDNQNLKENKISKTKEKNDTKKNDKKPKKETAKSKNQNKEALKNNRNFLDTKLENDFSDLVQFSFGHLRDSEMVPKKNLQNEDTHFVDVEKEFIITPESLLKFFTSHNIKGNKYGSRKADFDADLGTCNRMVKWWLKNFVQPHEETTEDNKPPNNLDETDNNENGDTILQELLGKSDEKINMNIGEFTKGMKANGFKEFQKKIINKS